jgi:exodeoxyribonuclease-3
MHDHHPVLERQRPARRGHQRLPAVQETKLQEEQLSDELRSPEGYRSYWACAEKKGYSGVGCWVKHEPIKVSTLGRPAFDAEGRALVLEYPDFTLINAYFPNSQEAGARLDYKLAFCDAILKLCRKIVKAGGNVIVCGDFNIAHKPIDLTHPKANEGNPGYLPEERAWMDTFTAAGYVDSFRMFNQAPGQYSWWSYRMNARAKNVGWRIDYHCLNEAFTPRIAAATIHPEVTGSDHCPVSITIN